MDITTMPFRWKPLEKSAKSSIFCRAKSRKGFLHFRWKTWRFSSNGHQVTIFDDNDEIRWETVSIFIEWARRDGSKSWNPFDEKALVKLAKIANSSQFLTFHLFSSSGDEFRYRMKSVRYRTFVLGGISIPNGFRDTVQNGTKTRPGKLISMKSIRKQSEISSRETKSVGPQFDGKPLGKLANFRLEAPWSISSPGIEIPGIEISSTEISMPDDFDTESSHFGTEIFSSSIEFSMENRLDGRIFDGFCLRRKFDTEISSQNRSGDEISVPEFRLRKVSLPNFR